MKNNWKSFISGVVTALLLTGLIGTALAAGSQRQATLNYSGIKITLDGAAITPTDASGAAVEPFTIDGITYLPVRGIANALGLGVVWDQATQTVKLLTGESTQTPTPSPAPQADTKYYADTKIPMFENIAPVSYESTTSVKDGNYMFKYNLKDFVAKSIDAETVMKSYFELLYNEGFNTVPFDKGNAVKLSNADGQTIILDVPEPGKYYEGSYLVIFASLEDSSSNQSAQKTVNEGTYKVGTDIQAGTYKLICTDSMGAYWARCKDASGELTAIIANDNFKTNTYVTVNNGEYLQLVRCTGTLQ